MHSDSSDPEHGVDHAKGYLEEYDESKDGKSRNPVGALLGRPANAKLGCCLEVLRKNLQDGLVDILEE